VQIHGNFPNLRVGIIISHSLAYKSSELRNVLHLLLPLTWRDFCHKLTHKASFERLLCKIIVIEINIYLFLENNFLKNKKILSLSHNTYLFLKFKIQNNF